MRDGQVLQTPARHLTQRTSEESDMPEGVYSAFAPKKKSTKKLTLDEVNRRLEPRGIVCLEYVAAAKKTTFRCPQGHKWQATPHNVMAGYNCSYCYGRGKTTDSVNELLQERGILCSEFKGAKTNTQFSCGVGHTWRTTPDAVLNGGTGCPVCAGKADLTVDAINARLQGRGIRALEYFVKKKKALFVCESGHEWLAAPFMTTKKNGCPHCANRARLSLEEVNRRLAPRGIIAAGDYSNSFSRLTFKCCNGHLWAATASRVLHDSGCPACAKTGFDPLAPAWFYVLRGLADDRINFGITCDADRRIRRHELDDSQNYDVLAKRFYTSGADARETELNMMAELKSLGYEPIKGTKEEFFVSAQIALEVYEKAKRREINWAA